MNKKSVFIPALLAVLFILNSGIPVSAKNYGLSPALEIISGNIGMEKCTVMTKELKFSREDFETAVGEPVEYITLTSLPSSTLGVLKYAGSDVQAGQSIPVQNIRLLKFTPAKLSGSTEFRFTANGNKNPSAVCTVNVLDKRNYAPYGEDMSANILSGIGYTGSLKVYDPDGDSIYVEIAEYPKNGVVKLCGTGFVYTALPYFSGKDTFSYNVKDEYGNVSQTANVKLSVREPETTVRYDDMNGHWGYTSVLKMTELGLMSGNEQEDGKLCFNPDEPVTRGDFLAMAMISAGLETKINPEAVTTFADDSEIPSNIRCYASYAQAGGIINGISDADSAVFNSTAPVSRAEAASMLSKILGESESVCEFEFTDAAAIPDWARNSFTSLAAMGIINGNPNGALEPSRALTRAEAAQMLCNVRELKSR